MLVRAAAALGPRFSASSRQSDSRFRHDDEMISVPQREAWLVQRWMIALNQISIGEDAKLSEW